ncbi:MAG: hypothetical protein WC477_07040 [Patescibacteria group bacterium]
MLGYRAVANRTPNGLSPRPTKSVWRIIRDEAERDGEALHQTLGDQGEIHIEEADVGLFDIKWRDKSDGALYTYTAYLALQPSRTDEAKPAIFFLFFQENQFCISDEQIRIIETRPRS